MPGNKKVIQFLDWLKIEGQIASKQGRKDDQQALENIGVALAPAVMKNNNLDDSKELIDSLDSFYQTYMRTQKFNADCKNPEAKFSDVMQGFHQVNELAKQTDACSSKMKNSSVKAAIGLATLGLVGGAISGAAKYGFKYALEGFTENGGLTIPGVVTGVLGLVVGIIGGLVYGAGTLAAKGWDAGKKWSAGKDSEGQATAAAFREANETLSASRQAAANSTVLSDRSTARRGPLTALPDSKDDQQRYDQDDGFSPTR